MPSLYSVGREVRKRLQHTSDDTNVGGFSIEEAPEKGPKEPTPKPNREVIDPFTPEFLNKSLGKSPETKTT